MSIRSLICLCVLMATAFSCNKVNSPADSSDHGQSVSDVSQTEISKIAVRRFLLDMQERVRPNRSDIKTSSAERRYFVYIQFMEKVDPDAEFLKGASTANVTAKHYSQSKSDEKGFVVDVETGAKGSRLRVDSVRWINADEVEVSLWQVFAPLGGGESIYRFKRTDGEWKFKGVRLGSVS